MTVKELQDYVRLGICEEHHTSSMRGYVSRKPNEDGTYGKVCEYNGRFGEGYVLLTPRWDTTNYVYVTYFIRNF